MGQKAKDRRSARKEKNAGKGSLKDRLVGLISKGKEVFGKAGESIDTFSNKLGNIQLPTVQTSNEIVISKSVWIGVGVVLLAIFGFIMFKKKK